MDKGVIEEVIKRYGGICPVFRYQNPLLDKNVTKLLSKGFLNFMDDQNLTDPQRRLVLENIRKSCKIEPYKHLYVDDNITDLVRFTYEKYLRNNFSIKKVLDSFLIRHMKEMNIAPFHPSSLKPEIIQSLTNLNKRKNERHDILLKDVIYWNVSDSSQKNYLDILKSIWNVDMVCKNKTKADDVSIKIKSVIEELLLTCAHEKLSSVIIDDNEWFSENNDLTRLVEMCSVSSDCFQISCAIMNSLFINTNFDTQMGRFITLFLDSVKSKVEHMSQLYPPNLQHVVLLFDINPNNLDEQIKDAYIQNALIYLDDVRRECEENAIMLLSHFSDWFDIYYEKNVAT